MKGTDDKLKSKCDVLLVTVTDIEIESLLKKTKALIGNDYEELQGEHKTYFKLGLIGGAQVFAVRSEAGSDTVGGVFADCP